MFIVYVIQSVNYPAKNYLGFTIDLEKRLQLIMRKNLCFLGNMLLGMSRVTQFLRMNLRRDNLKSI